MITKHFVDLSAPLTDEELKELEEAENAPYVPDDDCPLLTDEELRQFKRVSEE